MATPTPIQVRAEHTPDARRPARQRRRISGAAALALAGVALLVLAATHVTAAPNRATGPPVVPRVDIPARSLQPLPVVVVTPVPVVVAPRPTPAPVVSTPAPVAHPVASPGGVQGIQATPTPVMVPVPAPGILPPVATLPSPLRSSGGDTSPISLIALAAFVAILLGGTVMLSRRRL